MVERPIDVALFQLDIVYAAAVGDGFVDGRHKKHLGVCNRLALGGNDDAFRTGRFIELQVVRRVNAVIAETAFIRHDMGAVRRELEIAIQTEHLLLCRLIEPRFQRTPRNVEAWVRRRGVRVLGEFLLDLRPCHDFPAVKQQDMPGNND